MRFRRLIPVLALVLAGAGCQARAEVTVEVESDGSGTVEVAIALDDDAVAHLPDLDTDGESNQRDLVELLRVRDLEAAGWQVSDPAPDDGGDTWVRATKPFGTPEEATQVLAEVAGPDGPLHDLRVDRSTGIGRTTVSFSGSADLSDGLAVFGDERLTAALDGEPFGQDMAEIEQRFGAPVAELFSLDVAVDLPGKVSTNATNTNERVSWNVPIGGEAVEMHADATETDVVVLALVALAAASALGAVGFTVVRLVRRS